MRIRREREGRSSAQPWTSSAGTSLGSLTKSGNLQERNPHEGWLAFEVYAHGSEEFPNAQFDLLLEDSLGGSHRIAEKLEYTEQQAS